jgi:hypothetical protein
MRPPLHQRFVDKAQAAITAAVEVYNKPAFSYREETFAILALNAWELMAKAKLLKDADNDVRVIRVYESRETKTGKKSKKQYLRINAAGNAMTIGFVRSMVRLEEGGSMPAEVALNLRALVDIRDNSVHYVTPSATLAQLAQEVAAASVANFVLLAKRWFGRDLSRVLNLVLPLSFVAVPADAAAVVVSADETRLLQHLRALGNEAVDPNSDYSVAVKLQVKLEKSNLDGASKMVFSMDPDAVKVQLTDEEQYKRFPWTYDDLCEHMTKRFVDFKANNRFHVLRKRLAADPRFAMVRYLDMVRKTGLRKVYFNSNILPAFDEYYTKKS